MDASEPDPSAATPDSPDVLGDALESLSDGIAVFDDRRQLVTCNSRYSEMLRPIADLLVPGTTWEDILHACTHKGVYADARSREDEWLANVADSSTAAERPVDVRQTDGRIYKVTYAPMANGGFVVSRSDITEMRMAQAMVQEREQLLETILDTNPIAVVMARKADGKIIYRSAAAIELFGDTVFAHEHYLKRQDRHDYMQHLRDKGQADDYRLSFRDAEGRTFDASVAGRITEYNGEMCVVSAISDLSGRHAQEAMIRRVVQACPAPILMTRARSGKVLFKSPEIEALFGEVNNTREFYRKPEDRTRFLAALREHGRVNDFKARFRNAEGKVFWGAISARLIEFEDEQVIVSYSRDMTEQLEIEAQLVSQREQLFQNEKMSALGGLLAGVAHELNNPLSVVVGHALMLREETEDPEVERQTRRISDAAERCARIVKTFLTMARQDPGKLAPVDLNTLVATAVDVARYGETTAEVVIETDLDPDLPAINADEDQITQVVINLLLNSEQAIDQFADGGRILVRTRLASGGNMIRLTVQDDGPGVEANAQPRVFDPFFTTKGVGEGTGIGLAFSHRIISAHQGTIRLDTDFSEGARFVVELPVADHSVPEKPVLAEPAEPVTTTRVIVIDDEPDVADLNAEVLTRSGYSVSVAYSAEKAIALLKTTGADVVLSDLNMPDIDGRGFYEVIERDFPELLPCTGFITGDTMGQASQSFLRDSRRPYLEKPVSPHELRSFVAALVDQEQE